MKTRHIIVSVMLIVHAVLLAGCMFVNDEWSLGSIGIQLVEAEYTGGNTLILVYRSQENADSSLESFAEIRGKEQKYRLDRSKGSELFETWRYKVEWTVEPEWIPGDEIAISLTGGGTVYFTVPVEKE